MELDLILSDFDWDAATGIAAAPMQQLQPPPAPPQQVPPPPPQLHQEPAAVPAKKPRKRRADAKPKKDVRILENLLIRSRQDQVIEILEESSQSPEWLNDFNPERRSVMEQTLRIKKQLEAELQDQETQIALMEQDLEVARKRAEDYRRQLHHFRRFCE